MAFIIPRITKTKIAIDVINFTIEYTREKCTVIRFSTPVIIDKTTIAITIPITTHNALNIVVSPFKLRPLLYLKGIA